MLLLRGILLLCLTLGSTFPALAAGTPKPSSPLSVQIEALGATAPGGDAQFRVSASSRIDVDQLVITVRPPAGFVLANGALIWRGAVAAGNTASFEFGGTLPSTPKQVVIVTARVTHGMAQFGSSTAYQIDTGVSQKSVPPERPVMRDGRPILEVPIELAPSGAK